MLRSMRISPSAPAFRCLTGQLQGLEQAAGQSPLATSSRWRRRWLQGHGRSPLTPAPDQPGPLSKQLPQFIPPPGVQPEQGASGLTNACSPSKQGGFRLGGAASGDRAVLHPRQQGVLLGLFESDCTSSMNRKLRRAMATEPPRRRGLPPRRNSFDAASTASEGEVARVLPR